MFKLPTIPIQLLKESLISVDPWRMGEANGDIRFDRPHEHLVRRIVSAEEYFSKLMGIRSPEDARAFLGLYGNPESHLQDPGTRRTMRVLGNHEVSYVQYPPSRCHIYFREIQELQAVLKRAAKTPISRWESLSHNWFDVESLRIQLELKDGVLKALCYETQGALACGAHLFFEKLLSGAEYECCLRQDCNGLFKRASKHPRKYCSPECAHLTAVRASRERQRRSVAVRKRRRGTEKQGGGRESPSKDTKGERQ